MTSTWEKIKADPVKHAEFKEKRRLQKASGEGYRKIRSKQIILLGGQCAKCGTTKNLEINHKNVADTSFRREENGKSYRNQQRVTLTEVRETPEKFELLCKDCHQDWSCAQRKAAFALFASLSVEEQINQTKLFLKD